jgi:uncharacterized protein YjbJ (UPF0337 family)
MSATDKARNKMQKLRGKAKETIGRATGDRSLEDQGTGDRVKSDLKDAGEKVKDALGGRDRGRGRRRRQV